MKKFFLSLFLVSSLYAWGQALPAHAAPLLDNAILNEANCGSTGQPPCTLNTFVRLGINVTKIILGIVGSLTLVMFIYGGIMLLISGGNTERVAKGKEIIFGSVVGLLIVFGSYTLINFVVNNVFQAKINVNGTTQNAFTGSAPGDSATTNNTPAKTNDCTAPAPTGKGGTCVDTGQCTGGSITGGTTECGSKSCCVKEASTNRNCEGPGGVGQCFYTSCFSNQHLDTSYICEPKLGRERHCCISNTN